MTPRKTTSDGRASNAPRTRRARPRPARARSDGLRLYVLTCGRRIVDGTLQRTLESVARSDWTDTPAVCIDVGSGADPKGAQTENYRRVLERIARERPRYAVVLEDDVAVNRHLRANLRAWQPLREKRAPLLATLYNPNLAPLPGAPAVEDGFVADPGSVYGSQAFLLTPSVADWCLQHWLDVPALQDIKVSRLAAQLDPRIMHVHSPSLAQHVEAFSTHGAGHHYARDFDPWWQAGQPPAPETLKWDAIPGWFDWARFYEDQVRALPHGAVVVEVGVLLGRSIVYLAQSARALRKDLELHAVGTFVGAPSDPIVLDVVARHEGSLRNAFEDNLAGAGVADLVHVHAAESVEVARGFPRASVDLVFLDGDHSEEGVAADLAWWLPRVRPGGSLAGHDIDTYGSVARALDRVLGPGRYQVDHGQNLWLYRVR